MEFQQVLALTVFLGVFLVISTNLFHKTIAVLLGIGIYALGGVFLPEGKKLIDNKLALLNQVDWNVLMLIFSMMIITGFLKKTGFFQFLAIKLAKAARGNPAVLFFSLFFTTALFAAFFGSVTAVLVAVPVSILLSVELDVSPLPFLISETAAAAIGSILCSMGEPSILLVASAFGLNYLSYIKTLAPFVFSALIVVALLGFFLFRKKLKATNERRARVMDFDEKKSLQDPLLLKKTLAVCALVIAGFIAGPFISLSMSTTAICGASLLMLIAGAREIDRYFAEVEWTFVFFIAGLFALVGGLEASGLIKTASSALASLLSLNATTAPLLILWGSGAVSTVTDSVPYTAALIPFIKALSPLSGGAVLWVPLVLGVSLGSIATAWGASANTAVSTMAGKSGFKISFWDYTRYGLLFSVVTLAVMSVLLFALPR